MASGFIPNLFAIIATACPEIGLVKKRNKTIKANLAEVREKPDCNIMPKMINPTAAVSIIPAAWILL